MERSLILRIVIKSIMIYAECLLSYIMIGLLKLLVGKSYTFWYDGEMYNIDMRLQNLDTLSYIYEEKLRLNESDKMDEDVIDSYRNKYLKKHKIKNLYITQNDGDVIVVDYKK